MSRAYDPNWPFPQRDERGEVLLPPAWDDATQCWRPPGWAPTRRVTRAELERELRQGAGESPF